MRWVFSQGVLVAGLRVRPRLPARTPAVPDCSAGRRHCKLTGSGGVMESVCPLSLNFGRHVLFASGVGRGMPMARYTRARARARALSLLSPTPPHTPLPPLSLSHVRKHTN